MTASAYPTNQTWIEWRESVWNILTQQIGYPGLSALERYMQRSRAERRCVECGDPGVDRQTSHLINAVDHYWMCAECAEYWQHKA
jgi:hypothetical protein